MHELDFSTGKPAIAYATGSAKPWHGMGAQVDANASIDVWQQQAGLCWTAERSSVQYTAGNQPVVWTDKDVLYRSDNNRPLSVVSKDYCVVQPKEVLGFFDELCRVNDFEIETVGALKEGRRVWAMAKAGKSAMIKDDEVRPYLLLATSYDGSLATTCCFSAVRVVCANTMNAVLRDTNNKHSLSVPHSTVFNAAAAKITLGLNLSSWELFLHNSTLMAEKNLTKTEQDLFMIELLAPSYNHNKTGKEVKEAEDKVRTSKTYTRVMELFNGKQLGTGQDAINGSMYGLLNAFTQYIDHEHGRTNDSRTTASLFGQGSKIKTKAYELALDFV